MTNHNSSNTPLALPDVATTTDTLTATLAPVSLTKVEVLLNITHTWAADLDITLISPDGTRVLLTSDNGAGSEHYTNTTFSDSAAISIIAGSGPFVGWFIPEEALSAFSGKDGNGTWSLEVIDDSLGDIGELISWGIKLQ